jgi:hypothetical protein
MAIAKDTVRLVAFIEASKAKGASDDFLTGFLSRRGWSADDIDRGLGQYWERATGLPVPERKGVGESARDAFLYLLSFSTLATWSAALGSLFFQFINYWIADTVSPGNPYGFRSAVTWQMASIAVAFPIYLVVMRLIARESVDRERLRSGVRKWLTYIALFLTAGAMICDLICFLDYFLTGELTLRFVLKCAVVMLICGGIFAYYLGSLCRDQPADEASQRLRNRLFAGAACAMVTVAFCIGLGVAGTPARQRLIEADKKRVQDLRNLAMSIKSRHDQSGALPTSLTLPAFPHAADPVTGVAYEYHIQFGAAYNLCAVFSTASEDDRNPYLSSEQFWRHNAGRTCFALDASKVVPW